MTKDCCATVCAFASLVVIALPCISQQNPWNGSWKLDPSTLKYDGPTVSVAADTDGICITSSICG